MRVFLTVTRREIASFFYAPIAYVVGVAFLALNGFSFWALMKALSDPTMPARPGAVLYEFFGGTMLHWLMVFAVVALLSMRSVAEERKNGLWEATLTTRVSLLTVLLGKWSALFVFYVLLWLPTLGLIGVLSLYIPEGASLDLGALLSSYIGIFAVGAALLAIGLAFSAATDNQMIAAVGCFSVALFWLMAGEMGVVGNVLSLREVLGHATRGEVRLDAAVMVASVTVVALAAAHAVSAHGRHAWLPGWIVVVLLAILFGSALRLAVAHNRSLDLSADRINSLEPATLRGLEDLSEPVELTLLRPKEEVFEPVHEEFRRLLRRLHDHQPLLEIRELDPTVDPARVKRWAFELAIRPEDFASGGAILVQRGPRRRAIDLLAMASFSADDLGVGSLSELRAEAALRDAIAYVSEADRSTLCSSVGHGELRTSSSVSREHSWAPVAGRIVANQIEVKEIRDLNETSLAECDALMILGPAVSFSANQILALQSYRVEGGSILIALRSLPIASDSYPPTSGLALFLESAGMGVLQTAVVDPEFELEPGPSWMTYTGYSTHPIVRGFRDRRATLWHLPLALAPLSEDVGALVYASSAGWGERSLRELFETGSYEKSMDDSDVVSVALASETDGRARLVLLGSAEAFSSILSERGIGGNERLLISSIEWILGRSAVSNTVGSPRNVTRVRLLMSKRQLKYAFLWCVVLGPALLSLLGALLWWLRRRE